MVYCSEKSILSKPINDSVYLTLLIAVVLFVDKLKYI